MHIDGWTILLQAVNFLILVWLLRRFLYRPVLAVIAERQAVTEQVRTEAEAARQAAETARRDLEAQRTALPAERDRLIAAARAEAEAERTALLEKARTEADRALEESRGRLAEEREQALAALRRQAAELGAALAARLLRDAPADVLTRPLLDEALAAVEGLSDARRHALANGVAPVPVHVVAANSLPAEDATRAGDRLAAALGRPVALDVVEDSSLIAGVELHFAHSVVRRSWKQTLAEAKEEMTRHDSARVDADAVA
ncbi:F0F1 ATP synthase subunit delta [Azospirillum sp. YIM B02556]|uniref:ATP synthase subunit b n=1 Tax=Azospirillum endophyticum TaxID=2800326 RepID=A0ABS1F721_9PROT|nr:F0F1 ATP synthase subunit delta [Azospirillum endophyticum]MBK1839226.1 F0F1 ATP synthase subunit delta [Azospirillum endophyticum]